MSFMFTPISSTPWAERIWNDGWLFSATSISTSRWSSPPARS